jgi:hypothetical protein
MRTSEQLAPAAASRREFSPIAAVAAVATARAATGSATAATSAATTGITTGAAAAAAATAATAVAAAIAVAIASAVPVAIAVAVPVPVAIAVAAVPVAVPSAITVANTAVPVICAAVDRRRLQDVSNEGRGQGRTLRQLPWREDLDPVQRNATELIIGLGEGSALICSKHGALDRLGFCRDRRRCEKASGYQCKAGVRET